MIQHKLFGLTRTSGKCTEAERQQLISDIKGKLESVLPKFLHADQQEEECMRWSDICVAAWHWILDGEVEVLYSIVDCEFQQVV